MTKDKSDKSLLNGNVNLIVKIAAIVFLLGAAYKTIWKMEPQVAKNTEHRIKFEEKVENMEKNIALILKKVSE